MTKPVVLCILDGWGNGSSAEGNAPVLANTPNFDKIMQECPTARLTTHGPDVGLPTGQMGNSEVGHTNIGAGRVVAMDLGQIDLSIEDGSFSKNQAIADFAHRLKVSNGTAHLVGLVSDGGVHSHLNHIIAAAQAVTAYGVPCVVHAITDGRDVAPVSAQPYLKTLAKHLPDNVRIVTVSGRYFALDRDNRWERVAKAYNAMALGTADNLGSDPVDGMQTCYDLDQTDEFIEPFKLGNYDGMSNDDGVFFINFRADRAREILSAIGDPDFTGFKIENRPQLTALLGMVEYSETHSTFMQTVFPKRSISNTLGEWVSKQGKRQFRLAETEKYPHVTFFLNGGVETPYPGEDRFMPPSPKVATYDLKPEMSAPEVTKKLVETIEDGYDLIVVNYANPDMVGHTGDLNAAIKACEAVDQGLGLALDALKKAGGAMIVTADHGNCEMMFDPATGGPHTAHTTNLVPVIMVGGPEGANLKDGRLADLAPTVLALMELEQPNEMTGGSLLE